MSQIHHFRDYIVKDSQLFELAAHTWLRILRITSFNLEVYTVHGKIFRGGKLANLVNRELFAKVFLTNSIYLNGSPKYFPAKYVFPVYSITIHYSGHTE